MYLWGNKFECVGLKFFLVNFIFRFVEITFCVSLFFIKELGLVFGENGEDFEEEERDENWVVWVKIGKVEVV